MKGAVSSLMHRCVCGRGGLVGVVNACDVKTRRVANAHSNAHEKTVIVNTFH